MHQEYPLYFLCIGFKIYVLFDILLSVSYEFKCSLKGIILDSLNDNKSTLTSTHIGIMLQKLEYACLILTPQYRMLISFLIQISHQILMNLISKNLIQSMWDISMWLLAAKIIDKTNKNS